MDVVKSVPSDSLGVNYGSVYENAVSQELAARGHELRFYRSKSVGELDFVIESGRGWALPVEVKSGKDYRRHSTLSRVLSSPNYDIKRVVVLCEGDIHSREKVDYLPVYTAAFL